MIQKVRTTLLCFSPLVVAFYLVLFSGSTALAGVNNFVRTIPSDPPESNSKPECPQVDSLWLEPGEDYRTTLRISTIARPGLAYIDLIFTDNITQSDTLRIKEDLDPVIRLDEYQWAKSVEAVVYCSFKGDWFASESVYLDLPLNATPPQFCYSNIECGLGGHGWTATRSPTSQYTYQVGDTVMISGLPLLLQVITSYQPGTPGDGGTPGRYSGHGIVALPFAEQVLKVDFTNIEISRFNGHVTGGSVIPVRDTPLALPQNPSGQASDPCIPNPEGWQPDGTYAPGGGRIDPHGFNINGEYVEGDYGQDSPPQPYDPDFDPNGYNQYGIHRETGTPYNPAGCNREGEDVNGMACDPVNSNGPYYWIDDDDQGGNNGSGGSNSSGGGNGASSNGSNLTLQSSEFVDDNYVALLQCIATGLSAWETKMNGTIVDLRLECNDIRNQLGTAITASSLPRAIVEGENGEYYNEGMSNEFSRRPDLSELPNGRNSSIESLEELHAGLYACDEGLLDYLDLLSQAMEIDLVEIVNGEPQEQPSDFEILVLNQVASLLPFELQAKELDDPTKMCEYIAELIDSKLTEFIAEARYGYIDVEPTYRPSNDPRKDRLSPPAFVEGLASANSYAYTRTNGSYRAYLDQVEYEWLQGWPEVGGLHRAEYLSLAFGANSSRANACEPTGLPVEVSKQVGPIAYTIHLDNIEFFPDAAGVVRPAIVDVFYVFNDPTSMDNALTFSALQAPFNEEGFINGEIALNIDVPFVPELNIERVATLSLDPAGTTVRVGCSGFSGISIGGKVEFCRQVIIPLDGDQPLPEPAKVEFAVSATFDSWEEIIISGSFSSPFAIAAKPDVIVTATTLILDRSELSNHVAMPPLPLAYRAVNAKAGTNEWKGFYCEQFGVRIPVDFGQADALEFTARDFIIDKEGVSVVASVKGHANSPGSSSSLISLGQGSVGGWAASVDSVGIEILQNRPRRIGLGGLVHVPISRANSNNVSNTPESADCLRYSGEFSAGSFKATASPTGALYTDLLGGTVEFTEGTSIDLQIGGEKAGVTATLSGTFAAAGSNLTSKGKKRSLSPGSATFNGFTIQTPSRGALIKSVGTWEIIGGVSASVGGFGLSLNNFRIEKGEPGEVLLGFCAGISLTEQVSAAGNIYIVGKAAPGSNFVDLVYDRVKVQSLAIETELKKFRVSATLGFLDDDDVWGSGFYGTGQVAIVGLTSENGSPPPMGNTVACPGCGERRNAADFVGGRGLAASVLFGSKDDANGEAHKYFYVDAFASGLRIPIGAAAYIGGLGGGLSYGLTTAMDDVNIFEDKDEPSQECDPAGGAGESISGATYSIDHNIGLGVQIMADIRGGNERVFNSFNRLRFEFGNNGSIQLIQLAGEMKMMDLPIDVPIPIQHDKLPPEAGNDGKPNTDPKPVPTIPGDAPVKAVWVGDLNLARNTFDLRIEAFLNSGNIRGAGQNNSLVRGHAHFEPGNWFVKLGGAKPGHRAGAILEVSSAIEARLEAYFQVGNGVDPIPPLPADVRKFFGSSNLSQIPNRNNGLGIAFGAHAALEADFKAGIFYARAALLAGFDFNLQQYEGVTCAGRGTIGANGWYAQGQLYAYLSADAGVRRRSGGMRKLVELSMGALFQTELPNPTYFKGLVKARVKLGPVGGDAEFSVELGEQCAFEVDPTYAANGDPEYEYVAFEQLRSGSELSMDQSFSYDLTYAVGEEIPYNYVGSGGTVISGHYVVGMPVYKIERVSCDPSGQCEKLPIHGGATRVAISENKRKLYVDPAGFWPQHDSILVTLEFEAIKREGQATSGTQVHTLKYEYGYNTGRHPDVITRNNVAYSYPIPGQEEHLPQQLGYHYLGLKYGQGYLFQRPYLYAVYTDENNTVLHTTANVTYKDREIRIARDADFHLPEANYLLYLIRYLPPSHENTTTTLGPPVSHMAGQESFGIVFPDRVGIDEAPAVPSLLRPGRSLDPSHEDLASIFSVGYRTSAFTTWSEKLAALSIDGDAVFNGDEIGFRIETEAVAFDKYEAAINGLIGNSESLVSIAVQLPKVESNPQGHSQEHLWAGSLEGFQATYAALQPASIHCPNSDEDLYYDLPLAGIKESLVENLGYEIEVAPYVAHVPAPVFEGPDASEGVSAYTNLAYVDGGEFMGEGATPSITWADDFSSEKKMLYYAAPDMMYHIIDNTFEYFASFERQVVEDLVERECFSFQANPEEEALRAYRDALQHWYGGSFVSTGNRPAPKGSSRAALPLGTVPKPLSFRSVFLQQDQGYVWVRFRYRLPGDSVDRPDDVQSQKFDLTERP